MIGGVTCSGTRGGIDRADERAGRRRVVRALPDVSTTDAVLDVTEVSGNADTLHSGTRSTTAP
jgi:hypothetical protein